MKQVFNSSKSVQLSQALLNCYLELKWGIVILSSLAIVTGCGSSSPLETNFCNTNYFFNDTTNSSKDSIKITFLGTSALLIDDGATQILTDPYFSRHGLWSVIFSKLSTKKNVVDSICNHYKMDRINGIFVSHSHYDHAFDIGYVAEKTKAPVYGSSSTLTIARGAGICESKLNLFNTCEEVVLGDFRITVIPALHSPPAWYNNDIGQTIDCEFKQPACAKKYKEGGSFDLLIKHKDHSIYIKPSANFLFGGLDCITVDVLLLGIGGIGNESKKFKKTYYKETVGKLNPKLIIPIHWDNFFKPLSDLLVLMPRPIDNTSKTLKFIKRKTKNDKKELKILQGGKSIILFKD
ncbi:MAG: MBL fold metallo-hydrolase [Saprospiraceae bacterium]|nr:MBL fold metallo-hydrolase [Saprospiraceae bacterium]MBK8298113.1 MBL fold metallo-hydrolase [Saprospiraceae bacterium]